jgi:beta-glucanase (GH16 family)
MNAWLITTVLCTTIIQLTSASEWQLVWADEFDGTELDFSKWAVEENGHGGGNDELQYYLDRTENVRVENGHLILEAHKEHFDQAGTVRDYTSGRIRSKRRASWTYGRFEVRAQLPQGRGLWTAAWLLPEDNRIVTRARPLM